MKTIAPMKNQVTKTHLSSDIRNWERSERQKSIKRKLSRKNKDLRIAMGA